MTESAISNPFSTGGGGTAFEARVAACYLVSLLREEIPRGLSGGIAEQLRFQARQQGALLDDLLITSYDGRVRRRLALQIKHALTFSSKDSTFSEVISAAWAMFTNTSVVSLQDWQFQREVDRLGIGIGVIDTTLREHLLPILEWARACLSAQEFLNKINTPRFSHPQKRRYVDAFRAAVDAAANRAVNNEELWLFLRHFVVIDFDLENEGSRDATIAWNHLLDLVQDHDSTQAQMVFNLLIAEVGSLAPRAATLDIETARQLVSQLISLAPRRSLEADLCRLNMHADQVLAGIHDDLAGQLYLPRTDLVQSIWDALATVDVVLMVGEPGSGKSGILRSLARRLQDEGQVFICRAGELDYPMLEEYLGALQVNHSIDDILRALAGTPHRYLFIDGFERSLTLQHKNCLFDLLNAVMRQNDSLRMQSIPEESHWKILCTCRDFAVEPILLNVPLFVQARRRDKLHLVSIQSLTYDDMYEVRAAFPTVRSLWRVRHLQKMLSLPLYLDIVTRQQLAATKATANALTTEAGFADEFWRTIVRRAEGLREGIGTSIARHQTILAVAQRILESNRLQVRLDGLDPSAVQGLLLDMVLREENDRLMFAHDLLEDWALYKLITQADEPLAALLVHYHEPRALDRPVQLFAAHLLERSQDGTSWLTLLDTFATYSHLSPRWHDLILAAPLFSSALSEIIPRIETALLANNGRRLAQLLVALRSLATVPDPRVPFLLQGMEQGTIERMLPYYRLPWMPAWEPILRLLLRLGKDIPTEALLSVSEVLKMWMQKTPPDTPHRREVGSLALELLFASEGDPRA